jgi:ABC-type Zn uptake system ZnuABC Zn-binding protein ZnuA
LNNKVKGNMRAPARLMSVVLLVASVFLECGKGGNAERAPFGEKTVVAVLYPMYIATLNVAEGAAGVRVASMAANGGGCLHDYRLSPADAALIETASAFVANGGGAETFLDKALSANGNLTIIDAGEGIEFLSAAGGAVNMHAWMSVQNHIRQVNNIARGLSMWDTANAPLYAENARRYAEKLSGLRAAADSGLSAIANRKIAVSHDGFLYLAGELGLYVTAVVEKGDGAEPGVLELVEKIMTVKRDKPAALFAEAGRPSPSSRIIADETGLPQFELDMAAGGDGSADSYIGAMERNAQTLRRALK